MIGSIAVLQVDKNEAIEMRDDIEKKSIGLLKTIQKCEMSCNKDIENSIGTKEWRRKKKFQQTYKPFGFLSHFSFLCSRNSKGVLMVT